MQIILLGASGRTGSLILLEALKRCHSVTALVRTPPSLDNLTSSLPPDQKANLTIIRGSPLDTSAVANAVHAAAAKANVTSPLVVISALNLLRTSDSPWAAPHPTDAPPRMMADSMANVLSALKSSHSGTAKPKVIHVSALGVGASAANASWLFRTFVNWSNVRFTYEDHENAEAKLRDAADVVDWVAVRPPRLTEGDDGSAPVVWPVEKGAVAISGKCNRGAVARFCLDAAEGTEWDNKGPIIIS